MQVVQEKITLTANGTELAGLRDAIRKLCDDYEVRPNTARRVILAVDEAAANIIEHSTLSDGSSVQINIEIGENAITAELWDDGDRFDPCENGKSELEDACSQKRGFGLYLIQLVTDRVEYRRTNDGKNRLTLTVDSR